MEQLINIYTENKGSFSSIGKMLVLVLKAAGNLFVYGPYEGFISVRMWFTYKRLVRNNRKDPQIRRRIHDPKELREPYQSVVEASQVRDKSYYCTMQIPPLKN